MCKFNAGDKAIFVRDVYFDGVEVSELNNGVVRFYVEKDGRFYGFDDYDGYPVEAMFEVMDCREGDLCVRSTGYGQIVTEYRMLTEKEYEERFGHKFGEPAKPKRLRLDFVTSILVVTGCQQYGYVKDAYKQVIDFLEEHAEEW